MRKGKAFTLIELLVVIAIIALLVSILVPSLTRARDMAKKALCSTAISNHGKSMAMYISSYDSYPILSPWPWMQPIRLRVEGASEPDNRTLGWPTFYGLLEMNGLKGSDMTTWGIWYFGAPVDQIWDGCVCPAMDAPALWKAQDDAGSIPGFPTGGTPLHWMSYHQWASGYQFSSFLRSAVPRGRYPNRPGPLAQGEENVSTYCYQWIMGHITLGNDESYYIQAVNDEELGQTGQVVMATDTWDIETTPAMDWLTENYNEGFITPGWHSGPPIFNRRGVFNAYRHKGCPNILYADGHVASDANRPLDQVDDDLPDLLAGVQATTFSHYNEMLWGNLDRIIPMAELLD